MCLTKGTIIEWTQPKEWNELNRKFIEDDLKNVFYGLQKGQVVQIQGEHFLSYTEAIKFVEEQSDKKEILS